MPIKPVFVLPLLLACQSAFAVDEPLHYLESIWGVGSRDAPSWGALRFGFQQADLAPDGPAEQASFENLCSVFTNVVVLLDTPDIPLNSASGGCTEMGTLPLAPGGDAVITVPGGDFPPFVIPDREVSVRTTSLQRKALAFDTSQSRSFVDGESIGVFIRGIHQSFVAAKSTDMGFNTVAGDWAITRLEAEVDVGFGEIFLTVLNFPATLSTDGGGSISFTTETEFIESEFIQFTNGSPVEKRRFETTTEDEAVDLPLALMPDGELIFEVGDTGQPGRNPQVMGGFMAPTGDFFVMAEGVPGILPLRMGESELPDLSQFAAHQTFIGIRRNSNPKLSNRRYRLVGARFHPNPQGFAVSSWSEQSEIAFGAGGNGSWRDVSDGLFVRFGNDGQAGPVFFGQGNTWSFDYRVEDDGRIFLEFLNRPGLEQGLVNGYASPDNRALLFAHGVSLNEATSGEIGFWIALCSNCDPDPGAATGPSPRPFYPDPSRPLGDREGPAIR